MNVKRLVSGLVLFPIVVMVMVFGNQYIVDIAIAIIAIMSLHEFYKAFRTSKKANPITWLGYLAAGLISLIHVIPITWTVKTIGLVLPITMLILFLYVIITKLKVNITDIAVTLFGILYIVIFLMYISIIRQDLPDGKILVWFVLFVAWGTDIFAYLIGKNFGKHHFTEISPNKTIEGCVGGIAGSILLLTGYTAICQVAFNIEYDYFYVILIAVVLSVLSQIGDLAASAIKRYTGIKDFSHLIPGHGGMLDRIDSIVFIAPFAYFLLMLL